VEVPREVLTTAYLQVIRKTKSFLNRIEITPMKIQLMLLTLQTYKEDSIQSAILLCDRRIPMIQSPIPLFFSVVKVKKTKKPQLSGSKREL
jgi:hypothetical protein